MKAQSDWKRAHVVMALSLAVGYLGLDRFYLGQKGYGIIKLLTLGALGIWWLIDAIYFTVKAGELARAE